MEWLNLRVVFIVVGILLSFAVVIMGICRRRRRKWINQRLSWLIIETLKPGEKPTGECPGYRQGNYVTITSLDDWFRIKK